MFPQYSGWPATKWLICDLSIIRIIDILIKTKNNYVISFRDLQCTTNDNSTIKIIDNLQMKFTDFLWLRVFFPSKSYSRNDPARAADDVRKLAAESQYLTRNRFQFCSLRFFPRTRILFRLIKVTTSYYSTRSSNRCIIIYRVRTMRVHDYIKWNDLLGSANCSAQLLYRPPSAV